MHLTSAVVKTPCALPSKYSRPELVDENNQDVHDNLDFSDLPVNRVGDRVKYVYNGVIKFGTLLHLAVDPIHTQLLHKIKCPNNEMVQTAKEFVKFEDDMVFHSYPNY